MFCNVQYLRGQIYGPLTGGVNCAEQYMEDKMLNASSRAIISYKNVSGECENDQLTILSLSVISWKLFLVTLI